MFSPAASSKLLLSMPFSAVVRTAIQQQRHFRFQPSHQKFSCNPSSFSTRLTTRNFSTLQARLNPDSIRAASSRHANKFLIACRSASTSSSSSYSSYISRSRNRYLYIFLPLSGAILVWSLPASSKPSTTVLVSPSCIPIRPSFTTSANSPSERRPPVRVWLQDWVVEPFLTTLRFLKLAAIFIPVIICIPVIFLGDRKEVAGKKKRKGEESDRTGAVWWYGLLVSSMQRAGPSFVKLAQWAGSRTDLFPAALCDRLSELHSNGKPHSMKHTRRVIERVFQRKFEEVFEEFDEKPIGCGAIAQVYTAKLKPSIVPPSHYLPKKESRYSGNTLAAALDPNPEATSTAVPTSKVAIKIRHPKIDQTISRDLKIMAFFAGIINAFPGMEWLSFPEEVQVFGEMMKQQLDLSSEGSNLDRFENNFKYRRGNVSFPRPVSEFTTREVLVEEYENAVPLSLFLDQGGAGYSEVLANMGLDAFLRMLLLDNWTHGDLHPGNIMVKFFKPTTGSLLFSTFLSWFHLTQPPSPSSTSPTASASSDEIVRRLVKLKGDQDGWNKELEALFEGGWRPELIFIDAGLVTELDTTNRRNFLDLFQAIAEFDGYRAGELMVQRCRSPGLVIDSETFCLKVQNLLLRLKSQTFTLAKISIGDLLSEVLQGVRVHHVKMEGDFVNTMISILLLEGIGRQLDPNMDLMKSALPILRELGRQIGSSRESIQQVEPGNIGAMLKIWVWIEARSLISSAKVDTDDFIRYDWLSPNI